MIRKLFQYLISLEKTLVATSLALLMVFTLIQVIARNFFDTGFPQLEVISRHLVLYVAFLGAALIVEDQKHIKIDFLAHFMRPEHKRLLRQPLGIISASICGIFAWYAMRFWLDEWQYAAEQDRWIVLLAFILPAGFGLLSLHFLILAARARSNHGQDAP